MASWETKVENERYEAKISVKRRAEAISRNGYDPEKHLRNLEDDVLTMTVSAPDLDTLKKKIVAVLEGGL